MLTIHFLSPKEWLVIQSCVYFSTYKMNCQLKTTNILLLYFTDLFYSFYFMTRRLKPSSCCMREIFFCDLEHYRSYETFFVKLS